MTESESQLNRKISWIERTGYKGIILHPGELSVTGSDDKSNWLMLGTKFYSQDHLNIEVPRHVRDYVQIDGQHGVSRLETGVTYEIAILVMLKDTEEEGKYTVILELNLANRVSHPSHV
ncbi:uncharacterized protein A4U43_C06F1080 [Asparagus officinalis]|uniref:Uncharacterized protein n=1 Tax=Asparagus officinalis TaxID=4686 RepID=A0A5P1EIL3_ASPOF|nr:uncharacterized protein LOC109844523 [Asparagus officinalis]ONK65798.1 uncharacterized protein A4U43_C06F1080 [Asparagus officinalis]